MKNPNIEAKPAAASIAVFAVQILFRAAAYYHWFTPPPPDLTLAISTAAAAVAGWLAPHTSRTPPVISGTITGTGVVRKPDGELTFYAKDPLPPSATLPATPPGTTP